MSNESNNIKLLTLIRKQLRNAEATELKVENLIKVYPLDRSTIPTRLNLNFSYFLEKMAAVFFVSEARRQPIDEVCQNESEEIDRVRVNVQFLLYPNEPYQDETECVHKLDGELIIQYAPVSVNSDMNARYNRVTDAILPDILSEDKASDIIRDIVDLATDLYESREEKEKTKKRLEAIKLLGIG